MQSSCNATALESVALERCDLCIPFPCLFLSPECDFAFIWGSLSRPAHGECLDGEGPVRELEQRVANREALLRVTWSHLEACP